MVVDYRGGDTATIYASTQGTFTIAADAAKELDLTESAVTVSVEHMGGVIAVLLYAFYLPLFRLSQAGM